MTATTSATAWTHVGPVWWQTTAHHAAAAAAHMMMHDAVWSSATAAHAHARIRLLMIARMMVTRMVMMVVVVMRMWMWMRMMMIHSTAATASHRVHVGPGTHHSSADAATTTAHRSSTDHRVHLAGRTTCTRALLLLLLVAVW